MTYDEAVAALGSALRFGIHPSLSGIAALTQALGRPQDSFRSVQVTGTNGKSSVTRLVAGLLAAHGVRTGAYTSPHLERYAERFEVDSRPVADTDFADAVDAALTAAAEVTAEAAEGLGVPDAEPAFTEFELLTAAALWLFRERGIDVACLEVGMGGRWDATSIVDPAVAVVTGVSLDHTERLGSTIAEIAADKAHVIKPGSVAVLGPGTRSADAVFCERATTVGVPLVRVGEDGDVRFLVTERPARLGALLRLKVDGRFGIYDDLGLHAPAFQAANAAVAVAAAEAVLGRALDVSVARSALAVMRFPGRFELVADDPPVVLDGAHNPEAAAVLAQAVGEEFGCPPVVVLGVLADKDAEGISAALAPVAAEIVVTQPDSPRALPAAELAPRVAALTTVPVHVAPDLVAALALAKRLGPDGVLVTGSLYTVGAARRLLRGECSSHGDPSSA